jgi:hypothetical protein
MDKKRFLFGRGGKIGSISVKQNIKEGTQKTEL